MATVRFGPCESECERIRKETAMDPRAMAIQRWVEGKAITRADWTGTRHLRALKSREPEWEDSESLYPSSPEIRIWDAASVMACTDWLPYEPKPVEPERVRWKLAWRDDALRTPGVGVCDIPADALPLRRWAGYRFVTFIGHHNGKEIRMGALPVVYVKPTGDGDRLTPDNAHTIPVYPAEVEMVRVGGGQ